MAEIPLLNLTPKAALEILRECAADDRRVFFSPHARQRMVERQITRLQVLRCLEKGSLSEPPHRDVRGDWRCTVSHYTAGAHVSVAVAFKFHEETGKRVVIVTVF